MRESGAGARGRIFLQKSLDYQSRVCIARKYQAAKPKRRFRSTRKYFGVVVAADLRSDYCGEKKGMKTITMFDVVV